MAYSNDEEIENKLNNSNNSNVDIKAVRDLSASNKEQAREEINQVKQEVLLEDAIKNNDAYKRLKQNLERVTKGRIQVKPEEVAEIYKSMVSPSVNAIGNRNAFFVDDSLISMAVGGVCYDISIGESSGLVLYPDGRVNVEKSKEKVVILGGKVPPEKTAEFYTQLVEEKKQYMDEKKQYIDEKNAKKEFHRDSRLSDFFSKTAGLSKEDKIKFYKSKEGKDQLKEVSNDETIDDEIKLLREITNFEKVEDVEVLACAKSISELVDAIGRGESVEDNKEKLIDLLGEMKDLVGKGNKYADSFIGKDGEPDIARIVSYYREYEELYETKENLQFMQKAPEQRLWKVKRKIEAHKKFTPEDKEFILEFLERTLTVSSLGKNIGEYFSCDDAIKIALEDMEALSSDLVEDGKPNEQAILALYNSASEKPVHSIDEIKTNENKRKRTETRGHIDNLINKAKLGILKERTFSDLEIKENGRREKRQKRQKRIQDEEEESKVGPLKKINKRIVDIRNRRIAENISEILDVRYQGMGVTEKSAIIASAYLYASNRAFKAKNQGEVSVASDFENIKKILEEHIVSHSDQYKDIVQGDSTIDEDTMQELRKKVFLNGFEMGSKVNRLELSPQDIAKVCIDKMDENATFGSVIRQSAFKALRGFLQSSYDKVKPKKLLETGIVQEEIDYLETNNLQKDFNAKKAINRISKESVEKQLNEIFNNSQNKKSMLPEEYQRIADTEESLSQEQIDALIARMASQDSQEEQQEIVSNPMSEKFDDTIEKSFEERLREGVKVDERVAVQKTQKVAQSKAVLKVDEKTLRKMAFEACQKNSLDPMQINSASIDELQTLIYCYGDKQINQIVMQDDSREGKPVQEGMEI